jgi:hypothetical protein
MPLLQHVRGDVEIEVTLRTLQSLSDAMPTATDGSGGNGNGLSAGALRPATAQQRRSSNPFDEATDTDGEGGAANSGHSPSSRANAAVGVGASLGTGQSDESRDEVGGGTAAIQRGRFAACTRLAQVEEEIEELDAELLLRLQRDAKLRRKDHPGSDAAMAGQQQQQQQQQQQGGGLGSRRGGDDDRGSVRSLDTAYSELGGSGADVAADGERLRAAVLAAERRDLLAESAAAATAVGGHSVPGAMAGAAATDGGHGGSAKPSRRRAPPRVMRRFSLLDGVPNSPAPRRRGSSGVAVHMAGAGMGNEPPSSPSAAARAEAAARLSDSEPSGSDSDADELAEAGLVGLDDGTRLLPGRGGMFFVRVVEEVPRGSSAEDAMGTGGGADDTTLGMGMGTGMGGMAGGPGGGGGGGGGDMAEGPPNSYEVAVEETDTVWKLKCKLRLHPRCRLGRDAASRAGIGGAGGAFRSAEDVLLEYAPLFNAASAAELAAAAAGGRGGGADVPQDGDELIHHSNDANMAVQLQSRVWAPGRSPLLDERSLASAGVGFSAFSRSPSTAQHVIYATTRVVS